jgi:hypothetical protein
MSLPSAGTRERTRCPLAAWYSATAAMRRSSGYARALGTMRARSAWLGACSDSARLTPGSSAASARMRGTTPTVDTVTCAPGGAPRPARPRTHRVHTGGQRRSVGGLASHAQLGTGGLGYS